MQGTNQKRATFFRISNVLRAREARNVRVGIQNRKNDEKRVSLKPKLHITLHSLAYQLSFLLMKHVTIKKILKVNNFYT